MEDEKLVASTANARNIVKKEIITIAGRPGSGKSTTAKTVAAQLGFQHFSSGDLFRALGKERGIDVMQANLTAEENAELDHLVDERLRQMGVSGSRLVIDSRMAWHWMPASFKVFLDLDLEIAAQRIIGTMDEARLIHEHIPEDAAEYAAILQKRLDSESRRYKKLYEANPFDTSNYDLVINTAKYDLTQVVEQVISNFQSWI